MTTPLAPPFFCPILSPFSDPCKAKSTQKKSAKNLFTLTLAAELENGKVLRFCLKFVSHL